MEAPLSTHHLLPGSAVLHRLKVLLPPPRRVPAPCCLPANGSWGGPGHTPTCIPAHPCTSAICIRPGRFCRLALLAPCLSGQPLACPSDGPSHSTRMSHSHPTVALGGHHCPSLDSGGQGKLLGSGVQGCRGTQPCSAPLAELGQEGVSGLEPVVGCSLWDLGVHARATCSAHAKILRG